MCEHVLPPGPAARIVDSWGHSCATCSQLKDVMMRVRVSGAVDGRPCHLVVDTGAAKTVRKEVVAAQDLPVSDRQLCGVTGHSLRDSVMSTITVGGVEEMLLVFVADMEEPCLIGLDIPVQSAACVDLGRMQMKVRGETVPLIFEDAAEQVESPVASSDVEDERLELHCRVVREGEVADTTVTAHGRKAAANSCGGDLDADAGEASSALNLTFGGSVQFSSTIVRVQVLVSH
ncbi:hypothetical protein E2C01_063874 [Portunus trituberculatus]|uniref:Peptidase A2 domain-containing protein n=1 Tax=Portunus trituberculatus TaxID=210409 RepID=A0A5B7HM94_PORTR|nr:hypothetical protein [Portunus trituberculatus]